MLISSKQQYKKTGYWGLTCKNILLNNLFFHFLLIAMNLIKWSLLFSCYNAISWGVLAHKSQCIGHQCQQLLNKIICQTDFCDQYCNYTSFFSYLTVFFFFFTFSSYCISCMKKVGLWSTDKSKKAAGYIEIFRKQSIMLSLYIHIAFLVYSE